MVHQNIGVAKTGIFYPLAQMAVYQVENAVIVEQLVAKIESAKRCDFIKRLCDFHLSLMVCLHIQISEENRVRKAYLNFI